MRNCKPNFRLILTLWLIFDFGLVPSIWGAEADLVKANYAAVSASFAPLFLAQDMRLFVKHGLEVDLKYVLPSTATQALLGKSLDIVAPGGEIIEAGLAGARVVLFAGFNRAVFSLYSKPEIHSLSDLQGKVLGVTQPGSTTDFTARMLLKDAGMSPGKDVQVLHLKGMPEIIAALSKGTIDAGILSPPTTLKARQAGFKELVNITARNIPMIHGAFATTKEFLKDHPVQVQRFLQGYLEGIKIALTDLDQTKRIISKYTKMTGAEDLQETYQTFVQAWERVPYIRPATVQALLSFSQHPAAPAAKPEHFIDNSFLEELERSGFIDRLYQR